MKKDGKVFETWTIPDKLRAMSIIGKWQGWYDGPPSDASFDVQAAEWLRCIRIRQS